MRPPFEEGMCSDLVLIVGENTTALGKNLIEFIEGLEVLIDDGLVRQKRSAGWICGEYGGRNISSTPCGTSRSLATCQPAPSSTRMTCLSTPAPTSAANEARSALNSAVLTPSAMNHTTSPVAGRTKPYR
jgi:hypothetical protein